MIALILWNVVYYMFLAYVLDGKIGGIQAAVLFLGIVFLQVLSYFIGYTKCLDEYEDDGEWL